MTLLQSSMRKRLDEKFKRLNALRPLPASAVQKLREQFQIEMTYNTNAIEGNSLTLSETFLVVNEGLTVKGKPLKDHLEAKSHQAALEYLYELIEHDHRVTLSERLVRQLHQLVMQDVDREWAGVYRNGPVMITGTKHRPPEALEVAKKMHALVTWLNGNERKMHPIELAAQAHHKLAAIHPFFDGNGRTARLLMNVLLMRKGFPLTIILKNDRKKYYRVLSRADDDDLAPLVQFVAQTIERSLDIYLRALEPTTKKSERYVSLAKLSHGTSYSAKYLNLLVRTGRLEAHKDGRNWVTTKEALERYEEGRLRKHEKNTKNTKTINRKFSLSEYDPGWVLRFASIKDLVSRVFGDKAFKIEHVGSTAVPGMKAKPLIDVLVVVKKLEPFEKEKKLMIEAGYEWRYYPEPDEGLTFSKFSLDGEKLEHIHICDESSSWVRKFIVVRDYLRTHPEKAQEYSELKQKNRELYPDDYPAYRNAKAPFLERLKEEADKWEKTAILIKDGESHLRITL